MILVTLTPYLHDIRWTFPPKIEYEMREREPCLECGLPCPLRYDEMKNPYFTFLAPDNYYATSDDNDPQLMAETVKSFKSAAMGDSLKMSPATKAAVDNTLRNLRLQQR